MKGTAFHIAAWINWWGKAPKLEFYNDEEDAEEQPPMPVKPRRRPTTETQEEHEGRAKEWEATKPHKVEKRVKGNHMTQKYFVECLLPIYVEAVQRERLRTQNQVYLQEDGDPSHGMRKEGLAAELKAVNWVINLKHPAQSPDLNPIEGIWNIIKQRVHRRHFYNDEEVKQALQEECDKITLEEIRSRISDMPYRCRQLTKNGGKSIKTAKW
jgi:transposase